MDSRKKNSDRHLIAEQPGLRILVTGLLLAFFIGYTLKSYLSPARVTSQIEKAASHIHKDINVTFKSAALMLSDGILPRFSVVIDNIRMESFQSCWMAPVLEIDQLRLPISIWGLIRGQGVIQSIEANVVTLTMREEFKNCGSQNTNPAPPVEGTTSSQPLVTLSRSEKEEKYRNDVRSLRVKEFNIVAEKYPQYSGTLLDFTTKVKSFEPRVIEVRARTHLFKDNTVGDYLSHANLYVEYKESPDQTVAAHFFGNWREGHYSFIANYNLKDHQLTAETDLKHIPLSQILSILQKYDLAAKNLNSKQVWLSAKARLAGAVENLKDTPLAVRDLELEGDLGEMHVDQMEFTRLEPLQHKPIRVDVRKLDVEKLLDLLKREHDPRILGSLGQFTGVADINSDRMIRLQGEHRGLEFIFSNKGQRESQVIDRMLGEIALNGDKWLIQVNRVEPRGGNFLGTVKVEADRDFKNLDVKARVDEFALNPTVQNLMTQGGEVGAVSLDGEVKIRSGVLEKAKGLVRVQNMKVEGVEFQKTKVQFDGQQGNLQLLTQVQKMNVENSSPSAELALQVVPQKFWNKNSLPLQDLEGRFVLQDTRSLSWKKIQARVDKATLVQADGGWDENGNLKGQVQLREGKQARKWNLEGHRDRPRLILDNSKKVQRR